MAWSHSWVEQTSLDPHREPVWTLIRNQSSSTSGTSPVQSGPGSASGGSGVFLVHQGGALVRNQRRNPEWLPALLDCLVRTWNRFNERLKVASQEAVISSWARSRIIGPVFNLSAKLKLLWHQYQPEGPFHSGKVLAFR